MYERDGYAILRGLFDADAIAAWRAECDRLLADPRLRDPRNLRNGLSWRPHETRPERLDPVIDISPVFAALASDKRLLDAIGREMRGEPALMKDKLIFKPARMAGYPIHQDAGWWQDFPYERMASVAIAIDACDADNGALEIYAGKHRALLSTPGELRDMTEAEARAADLRDPALVALAPGDAVLFHALAPHRSAPNRSDRPRRMLYLTYGVDVPADAYARFQRWYRELSMRTAPAGERYHFA